MKSKFNVLWLWRKERCELNKRLDGIWRHSKNRGGAGEGGDTRTVKGGSESPTGDALFAPDLGMTLRSETLVSLLFRLP